MEVSVWMWMCMVFLSWFGFFDCDGRREEEEFLFWIVGALCLCEYAAGARRFFITYLLS